MSNICLNCNNIKKISLKCNNHMCLKCCIEKQNKCNYYNHDSKRKNSNSNLKRLFFYELDNLIKISYNKILYII